MSSSSPERFTTLTPWNHQPGLWITTILSITYAYLTLVARYVIRRKMTVADYILWVGYALATVSYILMFVALNEGVGKAPHHLAKDSYMTASKLTFASIILLILVAGCSSCSQIAHLEELVPGDDDKFACRAAVIASSSASIISAITVSASCDTNHLLNTGSGAACSSPIARWTVAALFLAINFLVPAAIPIYLFRHLRTKLRRKFSIYLVFAFPLINIPLVALAVKLFATFIRRSSDGIGIVTFLCVLEIILCLSLISPTIPMGKPMALRFTTHGTIIFSDTCASIAASSAPSKATARVNHRSSLHGFSRMFDNDEDGMELRPDAFSISTSVRHNAAADEHAIATSGPSVAHGDDGSELGIRKTVEMEVESMHVSEKSPSRGQDMG